MARVAGIEPKQAPFLIRFVMGKMRKVLGKDLTPVKVQARVPRVFWAGFLTELLLGQKAKVPKRQRALVQVRTAARVGCPF